MKELDSVRKALATFKTELNHKYEYMEKNEDPDGGEPLCGYSDWDESMYDYDEQLSDLGERLADAVEEWLK